MEAAFYQTALWSFFLSMMIHFLGLFPRENSRAARLFFGSGVMVMAVGFGGLTAGIVWRWIEQGRVPISSSYEYLSALCWFVALFYFLALNRMRKPFLAACVSPGVFLLIVFAGLYPRKLEMTLVPALQSYWLKIHVSLTIIGEAAFAFAFVAGVLYLVKSCDFGRVGKATRRKSLILFVLALAAGVGFVLALRALGLVLTGLDGPGLRVSLLGGGFLVAVPLYWAGYRKWCSGEDSHFGGLIFALAVVSLLVSGMVIGALEGKTRTRLEKIAGQVEVIDELIGENGEKGSELTADQWTSIKQAKTARLDLFLALESLHARIRHTLSREDARELLQGRPGAPELNFPLTLGEIRQERKSLQRSLAEMEALVSRIGLPASLADLSAFRGRLVDSYRNLYQSGWLPPESGRVSAFIGYMLILAVPLFLLVYLSAPVAQKKIPEPEVLDSLAYRAVSLGWPVFTFGALLAGAIWAHYAWGKWWSNDPKEIGSLIVWLVYTIYLHARHIRAWSGNQAALAAVLGFLFAVLSFVGNSVIGGLHAYG